MSDDFSPVDPRERILLLDVLRGFCMFGVLWSNLNEAYGAAGAPSHFRGVFEFAQGSLIELRFYSLLGFLFGMGFAIQLTRAEQRGVDVRGLFFRRMAVLLAIGILHGMLIWHNDVLTEYALIGMLLIFYRRLSPRLLLLAAAATFVVTPYLVGALSLPVPVAPSQQEIDSIYAHGTVRQIVAETARAYLYWYRRWFPVVFPGFLTLFVLGLWAVRVDLLKRLMARRSRLVMILAAAVVLTVLGKLLDRRDLNIWSNAAAYGAAVALVVSIPACARRLAPLAAVGRMSLTSYLTQSVVSVTLFYNYGFGLYGRVGFDGMLAITLVLFALQMAGSVWWLSRYRFGPVEWLWRSVAYGKPQPMWR